MIRANRGSDVVFTFNWKNTDGTNADLTGYVASAFEVTTAIASLLTVTLTTAATGLITVRIEWDNALLARVRYEFRVKVVSGNEDRSTNLIQVMYE